MRGSFLKDAREKAGLTQQAVADHMGVSYQTVWLWETGQTQPGPGKHVKLAGLLRVSVAQLREHLPKYAPPVKDFTAGSPPPADGCQGGEQPLKVGNTMPTEVLLLLGEMRGELKSLRARVEALEDRTEGANDTPHPRKGARTS